MYHYFEMMWSVSALIITQAAHMLRLSGPQEFAARRGAMIMKICYVMLFCPKIVCYKVIGKLWN